MATETLLDRSTIVDEERRKLALEASWEIESLLDLLIERSQDLPVEDMAIRGLTIRAGALNHVVMSAIDDEHHAVDALRSALTGRRAAEESPGMSRD